MILLDADDFKAILDDWGKNSEGRDYDVEVARAQLKKDREVLLKVYDSDDVKLALAYVLNEMAEEVE